MDPERTERTERTEFETFFRTEYRRVSKVLIVMGATLEEAEDAVAVAMIDAYRHWGSIDMPKAWVHKAAMRQFVKNRQRSRQGFRREVQVAARAPVEDAIAADQDLAAVEDQQWVTQMLDKLPRAQREVIALIMDGFGTKEIAELLGKREMTVRQHKSLARRSLRETLEDTRTGAHGGER